MSIIIIGDIHANFARLEYITANVEADHYIQVGDMGMWLKYVKRGEAALGNIKKKIHWIDGNHEYFPDLRGIEEPTEIHPNLIYVPRGTVLELDGKKIGFLGGADSVDKAWRVPEVSWFPDESITFKDVERLLDNAEKIGGIDLLITHSPPAFVTTQVLSIDERSVSPSAKIVQGVWEALDRPDLYCGHIHQTIKMLNVHIIGIDEYVRID